MSSWLPKWVAFWVKDPVKPMKPTDAMHQTCVRARFSHFLDNIEPPRTFRAAEVAQELTYNELLTLGYDKWEEVMPAVIELAFEMRAMGFCDILKEKKVLSEEVTPYDIVGGIRIRRRDD
jgi:hypothetical protein